MKYKQTDSFFNRNINKYGCLWFDHMDIAEEYTGHLFIPKTINRLYIDLTEKNIMDKQCFIINHEKSIQEALEVFGCHDKVTYAGAWYNDKLTDRKSWGNRNGMFMILQFKTEHGHSHFIRIRYDPYLPLIKFTNLISIRYYDIGI